MPTLHDIRKRIIGIKNTQQITRAMKMVSTAKLRQAIEKLKSTKFFLEKFEQFIADLQSVIGDISSLHSMFKSRTVKSVGIILIAGERGLCGNFNQELIRTTEQLIVEHPALEKKLILIGKKAVEYFRKKRVEPYYFNPTLVSRYNPAELTLAVKEIIGFYCKEIVDELIIVYMSFINTMERRIITKRLLPLEKIELANKPRQYEHKSIIFDPSPEAILNSLIPRFIEEEIRCAVLESGASEQAARMLAMSAATDRAQEIIDDTTLFLNRTRQALITKEISEVVGGAEALK